ncbi:MAG TPA: hypothetical protein DCE23_08400 [Firmicutes bacterium]|nr:hypothetical protein [Bacillota bacterium]
MKVLTLKQPWASLVANGYKVYEFRSWKTKYRGEILIHAGCGVDKEWLEKVKDYGIDFPKKKILCKVVLEDCIEIDDKLNKEILKLDKNVYGEKIRDGYAWKLGKVTKLEIEEKVNGQLGIWNYDVDK